MRAVTSVSLAAGSHHHLTARAHVSTSPVTPAVAAAAVSFSTAASTSRSKALSTLIGKAVARGTRGAPSDDVPDLDKRNILNLLVLGANTLPIAAMSGPYFLSLVPKSSNVGAGGQAAQDALGNDVKVNSWLSTHNKGDRSLAQGLKGDPTYLIVTNDGSLEKYGLNGVCTHLGCVVPWVIAENKFKCPCHGSQYDPTGKKVRGPAPLPLALVHTSVAEDDTVLFSPWNETDFRTGEAPWWK